MIKLSKFIKLTLILFLTPVLSGCPPLDFKIFIRNTTAQSVQLVLFYEKAFIKDTIHIRSINNIAKINNKTLPQLNQRLVAIADAEKTTLTIPPKHTVFLNDLIEQQDELKDKTLIIKTNNKEDKLSLIYPFKKLKVIKSVPDQSYNYFYKTIIYYDIN